jgi:hypothetical protein
VPFSVKVDEVHTRAGTFPEIGEGTPEPEAGVTVSVGGMSTETNGSGVAELTLTQPGTYSLAAQKAGGAPSVPVGVRVCSSAEPGCAFSSSPGVSSTASGGVSAFSTSSIYRGPYAVVAEAAGVIDGHVYSREHAPRLFAGRVLAHTSVASVSVKLRRDYRGRCSTYDGISEEFVAARCGHGSYFKVSTEPSFSYLLPSALAPGRYVLDIEATDAAGNHTSLARGTSRIVFYVA